MVDQKAEKAAQKAVQMVAQKAVQMVAQKTEGMTQSIQTLVKILK